MIKEAISLLAEGQELNRDQAHAALKTIMSGDATPAQIGAFITALRIRGESPDVIAGCADAMREKFTAVHAPTDRVIDTCGTGGDKAHTFNISTATAFVAAGAGITVAKHGNRSVSSQCGSADVLAELGLDLSVDSETMGQALQEIGIAFLFAPSLHPAMKYAIGPRREIGIRSVFNILGPLSNPAGAQYGVLGVYSEDLVPTLAEAAQRLGAKHLFVVHGRDGLDEITITTSSLVGEVRDGTVSVREFNPEEIGIDPCAPEDLKGGAPAENAQIIREVLGGSPGPKRDIILVNAAAAITAGGGSDTLQEGLEAARHSIDSGSALDKLESLARFTQQHTPQQD
jgi:anthranilate phosphoribosyltransferase